MIKANPHLTRLPKNYLFQEIKCRIEAFRRANPEAKVISLSIGDTTLPLPSSIAKSIEQKAHALSTPSGYSGYGPAFGEEKLREKIAAHFYKGTVSTDEIFISDGAKCDIGRLHLLFDQEARVAIQDPTYPVYMDTSLLTGHNAIKTLPCLPHNGFFPDLQNAENVDLIFFCSPNNPTGATATKEQLQTLVAFAQEKGALIIFDSAYAAFIQDPSLPRSIYEIEGARDLSIETSSFSKLAGFTGVRLGWTVVPKNLKFRDGSLVHQSYCRIISTFFNGASNLSQAGGLAALSKEGIQETRQLISYYQKNAQLLKKALLSCGYSVFGGDNAPYLWVHFGKEASWNLFQHFLERYHLVTTPGSGFGTSGEHFLRFSAFAKREEIIEAVERIKHASMPCSKSDCRLEV